MGEQGLITLDFSPWGFYFFWPTWVGFRLGWLKGREYRHPGCDSVLKIPERQTNKAHILCPRMLCPDGSTDSTEVVEGMEGAQGYGHLKCSCEFRMVADLTF